MLSIVVEHIMSTNDTALIQTRLVQICYSQKHYKVQINQKPQLAIYSMIKRDGLKENIN